MSSEVPCVQGACSPHKRQLHANAPQVLAALFPLLRTCYLQDTQGLGAAEVQASDLSNGSTGSSFMRNHLLPITCEAQLREGSHLGARD